MELFSQNPMLIEACVFNLSQMGELVHHLDEEYQHTHPEIPWRAIYGLRNRIVHDYDGVNIDLIRQIIHEDLDSLLQQLRDLP